MMIILVLNLVELNGLGDDSKATNGHDSIDLINSFKYKLMPEPHIQGCSCLFHLDSSPADLIFISDMGNKTWMKLDGNFILLSLKDSKSMLMGSQMAKSIGTKYTYIYTAAGINVNIEIEATSVCPPGSESCEGQSFKGTFTAIKETRHQTVHANGQCGC
jgi:hypothetical protein